MEGLVTKDPIKRDYKLTLKVRHDVWLSQIHSEFLARSVLDLIDPAVPPRQNFTQIENVGRCSIARDIIMSRLDDSYCLKVIDKKHPKEILD